MSIIGMSSFSREAPECGSKYGSEKISVSMEIMSRTLEKIQGKYRRVLREPSQICLGRAQECSPSAQEYSRLAPVKGSLLTFNHPLLSTRIESTDPKVFSTHRA